MKRRPGRKRGGRLPSGPGAAAGGLRVPTDKGLHLECGSETGLSRGHVGFRGAWDVVRGNRFSQLGGTGARERRGGPGGPRAWGAPARVPPLSRPTTGKIFPHVSSVEVCWLVLCTNR